MILSFYCKKNDTRSAAQEHNKPESDQSQKGTETAKKMGISRLLAGSINVMARIGRIIQKCLEEVMPILAHFVDIPV
jgi:hypothetical protein